MFSEAEIENGLHSDWFPCMLQFEFLCVIQTHVPQGIHTIFIVSNRSSLAVAAETLLNYVPDELSSNHDRDIKHSYWAFSGFPRPLQETAGIVPRNSHDLFFPHTFWPILYNYPTILRYMIWTTDNNVKYTANKKNWNQSSLIRRSKNLLSVNVRRNAGLWQPVLVGY
jgi:hypothetical protein